MKFQSLEGMNIHLPLQGRKSENQLPTSPEVVWLYPDGRGASVVVPEAAAEESAEIRLLRKM